MITNLKRGEGIDICHDSWDFSQLTIGLGWDVANLQGEIPAAHYPGMPRPHQEHDLDVVAILLNAEGKVAELGGCSFNGGTNQGDVIFHKAPQHASGAIWLTGDNRTGDGEHGEDDEQIIVQPDQLALHYHRILFMAVIHDGKHRGQHFGQVRNAYIRAVDARGQEICRYDLSQLQGMTAYSAMSFAELERKGAEWHFTALGVPHESDRFVDLLKPYL